MTLEAFAAECNRHIKAGHEFLAYWHPHGFMLLRQGMLGAYSEWEGGRWVTRKPKKAKASAANKLRKIIAQMKKDRHIGPVYTVEYMGGVLVKEGDADALQTIRIPGSSDSVDS